MNKDLHQEPGNQLLTKEALEEHIKVLDLKGLTMSIFFVIGSGNNPNQMGDALTA